MKKLTLILIIVLQILDIYCQNIDNKIIWIGSNRIYNYEADGRMNADTNEFLSSVLWFSENEINIISFVTDYDKYTTVSDTMTFEYSIEDGKIVGNIKNDTVVLNGIIDNIILRINIGDKKTNVDLTFLKLEREIQTDKNDLNEIKRLLTSKKWKVHVSGEDFYHEYLPNNKFKLSSWNSSQRWDLVKILDYYFIVTNDYMFGPYITLIKKASLNEIDLLVFNKESIKEYTMKKLK